VPVNTSNLTGNIEIQLTAYHNCDDVQLFWRTNVGDELYAPIPDCLGFMIERCRLTADKEWGAPEILRNRVGFSGQTPDGNNSIYPTEPSNIFPFQRYDRTDHGASNGETVKYRVVAVGLGAGGDLGKSEWQPLADSDRTEAIEVSGY
jgi:hypothetical protein